MEHNCENCKYTGESEAGEHCRNCKQNAVDNFEPMTKADRIRNMTDEELKMFFCNLLSGGDNCCFNCPSVTCAKYVDGMMGFLQSPAEV